jgi:hypothetical protein
MKDFDELLKGVLREDAAAQPRPGLESRVMARVQTDGQRRPRWRFVTWGAVAAALPVCIVALLVWPRSAPPVQHVKEVSAIKEASAISGSAVPKRVAVKLQRNQPQRVAQARISVRRESRHEVESLPKLDVFPTPAEVDMFPKVVQANGGDRQLVALTSKKVADALAALQHEQNEPIRIAAIEIAPLQTDGNSEQDR